MATSEPNSQIPNDNVICLINSYPNHKMLILHMDNYFQNLPDDAQLAIVKEFFRRLKLENQKMMINYCQNTRRKNYKRAENLIANIERNPFREKQVLAVNVAMVKLKNVIKHCPAYVAICNQNYQIIYREYIRRDPNNIENYFERVTGLTFQDFGPNAGKKLGIVKQEMLNIFANNLIIGFNLKNILDSFKFGEMNCETYDLQSHYRAIDYKGQSQAIAFRKVVFYYFHFDIEKWRKCPDMMAEYVMRIYNEKLPSDKDVTDFSQIKNIHFE